MQASADEQALLKNTHLIVLGTFPSLLLQDVLISVYGVDRVAIDGEITAILKAHVGERRVGKGV
jgi:hypothetical protein